MFKRFLFAVLATLIASFAFVNFAYAEEGEPAVVVLRYFNMTDLPIPVGEEVTFVTTEFGLGLQWQERIGNGIINHVYVLTGVDLDLVDYRDGTQSDYDLEDPVVGDTAYILEYYDFYDNLDNFAEDGIVDVLYLEEKRLWTSEEAALIKVGNEMYQDFVDNGLFYFSWATDCPADAYLMNGQPLQKGPYGNTYKVPATGGNLQAVNYAGSCWYDEYHVRWTHSIQPGDGIGGTEYVQVYSLKDPDPWYFCNRLHRMRPVWQPEELPSALYRGVCEDLADKSDTHTLATLSRLGFIRADTRYGDDHPFEYAPFVWWGRGQISLTNALPEHTWERVERIELPNHDDYNVTVGTDVWSGQVLPIISAVDGNVDLNPYDSDIPWYENWGDPIVFVSKDNLNVWDHMSWDETLVYRLDYVNGEVIIERAVWADSK